MWTSRHVSLQGYCGKSAQRAGTGLLTGDLLGRTTAKPGRLGAHCPPGNSSPHVPFCSEQNQSAAFVLPLASTSHHLASARIVSLIELIELISCGGAAKRRHRRGSHRRLHWSAEPEPKTHRALRCLHVRNHRAVSPLLKPVRF